MKVRSRSLAVAVCALAGLLSLSGCAGAPRTAAPSHIAGVQESNTATPAAERVPETASIPVGISRSVKFAVIGDYGVNDATEQAVAQMIASHRPSFILTTGDNYYSEAGGSGTARYDDAVGAYFGGWLKDITTKGTRYPRGNAVINDFFPTLGNHDYSDAKGPESYLSYFDLPGEGYANTSGNERYYEFVKGPVHFFALNSNLQEPAGTTPTSMQSAWLLQRLAASNSPWKIVYFHHPPYSSDTQHGPSVRMQWPFAESGVDAVLSGHVHLYERINRDGIVYFINGAGGERPLYHFGPPIAGSQVRYNGGVGAQIVTATDTTLKFDFVAADGTTIDTYMLTAPSAR